MRLGEAILNHYEHFFGKLKESISFRDPSLDYPLQILRFDGVFSECVTHATLGASHFDDEFGGSFEIVLVSDFDHSELPVILASTVLLAAERKLNVADGITLGNLGAFTNKELFGERAIYVTDATPLPSSFRCLNSNGKHITFKLAFFIYQSEFAHVKLSGRDSFESLLQEQSVDPFSFHRKSVA